MDKEIVRRIIEKDFRIVQEARYKTYAWRFKLDNKVSVFCGDKGNVWVKGKKKDIVEKKIIPQLPKQYNNTVFLVYGHDKEAIDELKDLMDSWKVTLLKIDELPTEGRTIIEQLEHYIPNANYGIILATPDDDVLVVSEGNKKEHRARQNVVFEAGLLFGKLGRNRTMIISKKDVLFSLPSDFDGYIECRYNDHISEVSPKIRRELKNQGYDV